MHALIGISEDDLENT